MRWVGIDEAGYGPNLGPLVMTAVVAEAVSGDRLEGQGGWADPPDLWRDLAPTVDRAGGDPRRLWVDDSKRILCGGKGRLRLESACLALLRAVGMPLPRCPEDLLEALGVGDAGEAELARWCGDSIAPPAWPSSDCLDAVERPGVAGSFVPSDGSWRLSAVRTVVVGPERFNMGLATSDSKARVHFAAFRKLLEFSWAAAADGKPTAVCGDKHGGRHYYLEPLTEAFPDVWIERGVEGPARSEYRLRAADRSMSVSLAPRADGANGLVALASIVSKTVREVWMDRFNAFWTGRIEGLRPTAGYPVDATRFRRAIEPLAAELGLDPALWWRRK